MSTHSLIIREISFKINVFAEVPIKSGHFHRPRGGDYGIFVPHLEKVNVSN